ncbi:hypothetical protein KEM48_005781 [Puccinia striiformis f. sp. tritici PST-130]|nr:hypothetical protein KEM48_005781 [Puccinia striiformis f. sp. tritici PST-130]
MQICCSLNAKLRADNADGVSPLYPGTPALKTDFTKLGIRTKRGAFDDGVNSVMRSVKNSFMDGPQQDSCDLFTGAWAPPTRDSDESQSLLFVGPYDQHLIQAVSYSHIHFYCSAFRSFNSPILILYRSYLAS